VSRGPLEALRPRWGLLGQDEVVAKDKVNGEEVRRGGSARRVHGRLVVRVKADGSGFGSHAAQRLCTRGEAEQQVARRALAATNTSSRAHTARPRRCCPSPALAESSPGATPRAAITHSTLQ